MSSGAVVIQSNPSRHRLTSFIQDSLTSACCVEKVLVVFIALFSPCEEPQDIPYWPWGYLSTSWTLLSVATGRVPTPVVVLGDLLAFLFFY